MATSAIQGKNPNELLAMQTQTMLDLYQLQQQQQEQIKQLLVQQQLTNQHLQDVGALLQETDEGSDGTVEITNFNMPFGSLMVFLVKFVFAAIPAAIISLALWYVVSMLLFSVLFRSFLIP